MTATIYDVAGLAGVSHQTVSRVVNHRAGVAASTRACVEAAISELGYRVDEPARQLGRRGGRVARPPQACCPTCGATRRRWRPDAVGDDG